MTRPAIVRCERLAADLTQRVGHAEIRWDRIATGVDEIGRIRDRIWIARQRDEAQR